MPDRQSPSSDTHAYIPPAMEQAMTQQLQSSLPAHLRQYVGQSQPAYVPEHIEKELAQHMQNMPAHLQQYSGAYLQQRVVKPGLVGLDPYHATASLPSRPPVPDHLRLGHSMPVGEQFTAQVPGSSPPNPQFSPADDQQFPQVPPPAVPQTQDFPSPNPAQLPSNSPYAQQPMAYPPAAPDTTPHTPEYGFIMSPEAAPRRSWSLPGGSSQTKRLLTIFGGVFALLVIFLVIKGLLGGGGPNLASFTAIGQDQQELIHLTTSTSEQQPGISTTSQNIAVTVQLSATSAQTQLLAYLAANHEKIGTKVLALKISPSLDTQLTNAAADSTYDQTFQQIIQAKLTAYQQDLKQAYAQTKGSKGRQLLNGDYNGATLLLKQIASPAN